MTLSRRRVLLTGTVSSVGMFAGCLGTPDDEGTGDENSSSATGSNQRSRDELVFDLVDDPPHTPVRPSSPDDVEYGDSWDDHHLGDGMDTDTAVSFDSIDLRLTESVLDVGTLEGESVFYADLLTSRESIEDIAEPVGDDASDRLEAIDFDDEAVVVVTSGFGSSSVRHEWVRVDDHCEKLHVHGYYVWPYLQNRDYATRTSGIIVEQPTGTELQQVWVSLTVDETTRVNVPTDGEVHEVDDDGKPGDDDPTRRDTGQSKTYGSSRCPATRTADGDVRKPTKPASLFS